MNQSTKTAPFIPENAPFSQEQRSWLNGFLAGMYSEAPVGGAPAAPAAPPKPVTVLIGSQTGTSESLGKQTAKRLKALNCEPKVVDMADANLATLQEAGTVLIITSTYGDGEPPDNAQTLHAAVMAEDASRLDGVEFAVLGLGDSSYPDFCQCSKDFDRRLENLGGKRIVPTVECDVDTDEPFEQWIDSLSSVLAESADGVSAPGGDGSGAAGGEGEPEESGAPVYSKANPFPAKLLKSENLNKEGSSKATHHVEISLEASGLLYEVGDALGVVPVNCDEMVADLLELTGLGGDETVVLKEGEDPLSLREALRRRCDIRSLNAPLVQAYLERVDDPELAAITADKEKLDEFLWGREPRDLIARKPDAFGSAEALTGFLKKLQPRLYSISSSPKAHPGEVHLTVGKVVYEGHGLKRRGVCSSYLSDRLTPEEPVHVYLHTNQAFRLPEDDSVPVVMIGPGTGIAPFRAFLEEREARGAKGPNWLFFGDQHIATDFLYEEQITGWLKSGVLQKFDTAFSRDQKEKVYVQDRILERAEELVKWLEQGAHVYVCGDASRMAKDVDAALHKVFELSGKTPEEAAAAMNQLKKEKRYLRDVY